MADFGIINLQAEGDITSYDPPEALVYDFGTFHDEINDIIVSVMSLLPNSNAKPSINNLRRTKEKPGAKRSVLKANKAFSKIEIPKNTPVIAELDDNDAMHIPFFQYANADKYYVLENQGKSRRDILQQSVDLSKLKNTTDSSPLTSYYHQDFDLKSEHPGVTFIDKQRASFAGLFTGPIRDGHHTVALHGFLQEPVNIAVRSGFKTRVVKLPIGFEMVVPLKFGVVHFDEDGKPERWTTTPAGFVRLYPPPRIVTKDEEEDEDGGDGGVPATRRFNIPPPDPNMLNIPQFNRIPPPDPNMLNIPLIAQQNPVEPPSLENIEIPTIGVERTKVEEVAPVAVTIPTEGPSSLQKAMSTTGVERTKVEEVAPVAATIPTEGPSSLQKAVTRSVQGAEPISEGEITSNVEAEPISEGEITSNVEPISEGEITSNVEPISEGEITGKIEAEPIPVGERKPVQPTVRTATVTPKFNEDVIKQMSDYIRNTGVEMQDVEGALERYEPLSTLLNHITTSFPNRAYTFETPSKTNDKEYNTFPDKAEDQEYIARISFNEPQVVYEFRLDIDTTTPSNVVERIEGRTNIVAIARPVSFRMKPNRSLFKYILYLRRGTPVVVARPAEFRMEPNESLREFVKIEP